MNTVNVLSADPKASYLAYKNEIDQAINRVLNSGWYILGEEVQAFENEFAEWNGNKHAIGVANGTDAIEISLRALGLQPGEQVLTVSNTAVATVVAIERAGGIPVFVDIDPETYTIDPKCLASTLDEINKTRNSEARMPRIVVPVHLYGHPADMPTIMEVARKYNLMVIKDCAQAHGATINDQKVGTWGDIAAFSLYPTKNLGAIGDGGVVVTNDSHLAHQVTLLRQYGWEQRYISLIAGMNSRLDPIQAAILRVKLRFLDDANRQRQIFAAAYNEGFEKTSLIRPRSKGNVSHVYHQYVLRSSHRDEIRKQLHEHKIGTQILYPTPIHLQPAYEYRIPLVLPLSITEQVSREIFTLPIYPELNLEQIEYAISCLTEILGQIREEQL